MYPLLRFEYLIPKTILLCFFLFILPFHFSKSSSEYANTRNTIGTIIDDFLVNDDTTGGSVQSYPRITRYKSSDYVAVWEEYRNLNYEIYAQRYSSVSTPLGTSFKVNDDSGFGDQRFPSIASASSGNFVIIWQDFRNGNYDIWAQLYDSAGIPLGSNFRVDDDTGNSFQEFPAAAMDSLGNFIITWRDQRNVHVEIYAQRYDHLGTPLGSNFKVCDDDESGYQGDPAVAMNNSGNFVITWRIYPHGIDDADIYAQRYDSTGTSVRINLKVNDDFGSADQRTPAIAMDRTGNFVITWDDDRSGLFDYDIYAQRYDLTGIPQSSNFRVNTGSAFSQRNPAIAMNGAGEFVVSWTDYRINGSNNPDIYARRYSSSGTPLSDDFKVNDDSTSADHLYSATAMDGVDNFIVAWCDYRNGILNPDIYAQLYNTSGIHLGSNSKLNGDGGTSDQNFPAIGQDGFGNFVVTWQDARNGDWAIYAQRYNSSGTPLGSNFKVNDAWVSGSSYPAIALARSGFFVITWGDQDFGEDYSCICAQMYDSAGVRLGSNFKVNDDTVYWPDFPDRNNPSVGIDTNDNFVITWVNSTSIYAKRYNSTGTPLGLGFWLSSGTAPRIAVENSGGFIITWGDWWYGSVICARMYSSTGSPLGNKFKVNEDSGDFDQWSPSIGMDTCGNFVITWMDNQYGLSNTNIHAQKYDVIGNPNGGNCLISNPQYASFAQCYPTVVANTSNLYLAWQDNRRVKGWDIYAKVVDWNWSKVEETEGTSVPHAFQLSQNYPNPFNPTTIIHYSISSNQPTQACISIYNILGQRVRTLVDETKRAGNYEAIWDGKDDKEKEVASGIYFYQLTAGKYSESKKMLLLK